MKLDLDVTVARLLAAIPSSALVMKKLGITTDGNEHKTLQQVCADHRITPKEFLEAMDKIDWNKESAARESERM